MGYLQSKTRCAIKFNQNDTRCAILWTVKPARIAHIHNVDEANQAAICCNGVEGAEFYTPLDFVKMMTSPMQYKRKRALNGEWDSGFFFRPWEAIRASGTACGGAGRRYAMTDGVNAELYYLQNGELGKASLKYFIAGNTYAVQFKEEKKRAVLSRVDYTDVRTWDTTRLL